MNLWSEFTLAIFLRPLRSLPLRAGSLQTRPQPNTMPLPSTILPTSVKDEEEETLLSLCLDPHFLTSVV